MLQFHEMEIMISAKLNKSGEIKNMILIFFPSPLVRVSTFDDQLLCLRERETRIHEEGKKAQGG